MNTREAWLELAASKLWDLFPHRPEAWPAIKVSVGFPKGGRQLQGQCWGPGASGDEKTAHVFICPSVIDTVTVLGILLHEQVHAVVGVEHKHKSPFAKMAKAVGFEPKWTSSSNKSSGLVQKLQELAKELPPYPHVSLTPAQKEKQTTRQKLWVCAHGKKVRAADADPLNATCNTCGTAFVRQEEKEKD